MSEHQREAQMIILVLAVTMAVVSGFLQLWWSLALVSVVGARAAWKLWNARDVSQG